MNPQISFCCENDRCSEHKKTVALHYSPFFAALQKEELKGDYWTAKLKHCPKCYQPGSVEILYGTRFFGDLEAFESYLVGLAKETRLLKKLVDRGVAEDAERIEYEKNLSMIQDALCPCCGNRLIDMVH